MRGKGGREREREREQVQVECSHNHDTLYHIAGNFGEVFKLVIWRIR